MRGEEELGLVTLKGLAKPNDRDLASRSSHTH